MMVMNPHESNWAVFGLFFGTGRASLSVWSFCVLEAIPVFFKILFGFQACFHVGRFEQNDLILPVFLCSSDGKYVRPMCLSRIVDAGSTVLYEGPLFV